MLPITLYIFTLLCKDLNLDLPALNQRGLTDVRPDTTQHKKKKWVDILPQ